MTLPWWRQREYQIVLLIMIGGAFARLFFLNYGLPHLLFVDEEFFVQPALRIAAGNLNPGWFGAPAQPLLYGLGLLFRGVNFLLNTLHHSNLPVEANYQAFVTVFQTAGRSLGAIGGG